MLSFKRRGVDDLAKKCFPAYTVVDFGSGTGAYARYFLGRCPATVIALDWSPEALAAISCGRGKVLPVCADLHMLPIKSSRVDALFSVDTLGHLRRQDAALDEIVRACRGGAPLFLHAECSDYRRRWPDRALIRKTGADRIADLDGHISLRRSREMRSLYLDRFSLLDFFSPAGVLGWLLGYPEKYTAAFRIAEMPLLSHCSGFLGRVRTTPLRHALRLINMCTNRLELLLGLQGGGSCFASLRTHAAASASPPENGFTSIDVVIPTYGRPELIPKIVTKLLGQCGPDDRIFVVWQGPERPPTVSDERVRYIRLKKPNLPAARNAGTREGMNPVVLFLDDDCTPEPGLIEAHRSMYTDSAAGAVAGFVEDPLYPGSTDTPSWLDITTGELRQNFSFPESCSSISVPGGNMSFRRRALASIGGFDHHYRGNALWEEIDASFRLLHAGYGIRYSPHCRVSHHGSTEGGCRSGGALRHIFHLFANTTYFACTYAPLRHVPGWCTFWKHRLEYLSRRSEPSRTDAPGHGFRHHPLRVAAGCTGVVTGIIRFLSGGRRLGLPETVTGAHARFKGSRR